VEVVENIGTIIGRGHFIENRTSGQYNFDFTQHCVILAEEPAEFLVSYFDTKTMTQTQRYIKKSDFYVKTEAKEKSYWVIKNEMTGEYWSAARSPSTAPQLYLTKGKAEGRCKQVGGDPNWKVKKWTITETND
jgi:hypothetical protein